TPTQPPSDSANRCYLADGKTENTYYQSCIEAEYYRFNQVTGVGMRLPPLTPPDPANANAPMAFTNSYDSSCKLFHQAVQLAITQGPDAVRNPGGSTSSPSPPAAPNVDWQVMSVTYNGPPPVAVNGACGTANGQNYSMAPSGNELCGTG